MNRAILLALAFSLLGAHGEPAIHRGINLGNALEGDTSRARWTTCCARTAESLGIGWSYWEFCAGFGAYDPVAKQWRQPLLDALIPPASR
jgi:hypothetical protein